MLGADAKDSGILGPIPLRGSNHHTGLLEGSRETAWQEKTHFSTHLYRNAT